MQAREQSNLNDTAGDGEDGRMYVLLLFIPVFMRLAKADIPSIPSLSTDDYRTLLSSCIRLSITYYNRDFVIFSNLIAARST